MSSNPIIAPCGIDCSACEIYKAAHDPKLAEEVAKQWRESWQPKADASWFVCKGCRGDRSLCWSGDCKIHACCVEQHGLDSCSACDDFPCEELQKWASEYPHHGAAFERLNEMRRGDS